MTNMQNESPMKPSLKTRLWVRTLDRRPASAVMYLEDDDGRLLVVKSNYKKHWSLPGGIVDKGETPLTAAIREVKEEVGLTIDSTNVTFKAVVSRQSSLFNSYQFVFAAPLYSYQVSEIVLQASEIDEYALVDRDEILTHNRPYGKIIYNWANDVSGYSEQQLRD